MFYALCSMFWVVRGCLKSIFYKRELLKIDYLILLSHFGGTIFAFLA
jgi:hypothetical protein